MSNLLQIWNEWEIQLMVLTSFILQLLLMLTGNLRRRNISGLLRGLIWLAYVGADSVAVYALGLFSQYEDKYKLGSKSYGDTLPYLWVPFLLVHLGGQDSITAFSIEDNNLWLRHLLNLGIQVALGLFVFWKSSHRIHSLVLTPAAFIFISGIIKYGERTWALKSGSRDGLGAKSKRPSVSTPRENSMNTIYSYALQTVLLARGLFVGQTVLQLGDAVQQKVEDGFVVYEKREEKLKIIMTELRMMFDLLYSKAMVLQGWWGCIFRCVAQMSMVVAFVLFIRSDNHVHNRVNVAISYTLFLGAIFMECCSIATALASPWTRAHMQEGSFLYCFFSKANQRNKKPWLSISMGQFNRMDFSITDEFKPRMMSKILSVMGLKKKWRILWYTKHIEAQGIIEHVVNWFDGPQQERFRRLQLNRKLNHTLALPFEHAIYRLHIYTDLHISRHFGGTAGSHGDDVILLKEECEKLSNYVSYLMAVYPLMLPVSAAAEDVGHGLPQWLKTCGETTKLAILEKYAAEVLLNAPESACPFEPAQQEQDESALKRSLEEIKEVWVRLLIYSAGKCRGELHAQQLGNGQELLTFVWLLMVHHGLGDVATELSLLKSDDPVAPEPGSLISVKSYWSLRPELPRYAFDFRRHCQQQARVSRERQQLQLVRMMQLQVMPDVADHAAKILQATDWIGHQIEQFLLDETERYDQDVTSPTSAEQDEVGISGKGEHDEAGTSSEIVEK
ncbi:unnamed protein product [Urochloa humidicola]